MQTDSLGRLEQAQGAENNVILKNVLNVEPSLLSINVSFQRRRGWGRPRSGAAGCFYGATAGNIGVGGSVSWLRVRDTDVRTSLVLGPRDQGTCSSSWSDGLLKNILIESFSPRVSQGGPQL